MQSFSLIQFHNWVWLAQSTYFAALTRCWFVQAWQLNAVCVCITPIDSYRNCWPVSRMMWYWVNVVVVLRARLEFACIAVFVLTGVQWSLWRRHGPRGDDGTQNCLHGPLPVWLCWLELHPHQQAHGIFPDQRWSPHLRLLYQVTQISHS